VKVSKYIGFCETDMQTGLICLQNELLAAFYTFFSLILNLPAVIKIEFALPIIVGAQTIFGCRLFKSV
jgi:hypothetical protein